MAFIAAIYSHEIIAGSVSISEMNDNSPDPVRTV